MNSLRGSDTPCLPNLCHHLVGNLPNLQARKIPLKLTNGVSKVTRHFLNSANDYANRRLQSTNTIINRVIMFAVNTGLSRWTLCSILMSDVDISGAFNVWAQRLFTLHQVHYILPHFSFLWMIALAVVSIGFIRKGERCCMILSRYVKSDSFPYIIWLSRLSNPLCGPAMWVRSA